MIKLTHYDETEKRANDSQKVRAKQTLKVSHSGPSFSQASGTNPLKLYVRSIMTHRRANQEETIAINCDWVYNQACRLWRDMFCVGQVYIDLKTTPFCDCS